MRIGIYGRVENSNFGGALTYYALFKYLKSIGEDVKIIPMAFDQKCEADFRSYNPDSEGFKFAKEREDLAERKFYKDFKDYNKEFDAFILGSDICFEDKCAQLFNDSFYLNFVDDNKIKIAVSPSCQSEDINKVFGEERIDIVCSYLKRFNKISVRDDFSKNILNQIGINCEKLLDPVFLLNKEDYISIAADKKDFEFDFYYLVNSPKEIDLFSLSSEIRSDRNIVVTPQYNNKHKLFESEYSIINEIRRPEYWLSNILYCKNFVTSSFHGMCFALLLHKPFYAILNKTSHKQRDLLNFFGLYGEDHSNLTEKDFCKIDKIINNERDRLITFIQSGLHG